MQENDSLSSLMLHLRGPLHGSVNGAPSSADIHVNLAAGASLHIFYVSPCGDVVQRWNDLRKFLIFVFNSTMWKQLLFLSSLWIFHLFIISMRFHLIPASASVIITYLSLFLYRWNGQKKFLKKHTIQPFVDNVFVLTR